MDYEIAIIGAGPSGCAAGIYAGRGGAHAVVYDKGMGGGLAINSPRIENYPGFLSVGGMELMEKMKEHASQYAEMKLFEEVKDIKIDEEIEVITDRGKYSVKAVIICTGTQPRKLNVKGEEKFTGRGVSYCATCDGFFFKGKKVAVVGGGNSAIIEAIYLSNIGADVSVIHRRDELRAEKIIEKEAREKGINFVWNSVVDEIFGNEKVEGIKIRDVKTNELKEMSIDGIFVSIGEEPNNGIAKKIGLALDEHGFIKADDMGRTNIDRIFAAGDITGGVRQIVVAVSQGAKAAISAMKAIGKRSIWDL